MASCAMMPGLIDCHVHFREPGGEHKADMASEAAAARAGGIFTVCEMPNTNPPTQTVAAFEDKVRRAERCKDVCDLRFFFGATKTEHIEELRRLWTEPELAALKARCSGLKLYLDNSTGDQKADGAVTAAGFKLCGELDIPLVAHCEHTPTNEAAAAKTPYTGAASHSVRRPEESEAQSIEEAIALAKVHGTPLHVAHLSTEFGVNLVRVAKQQGQRVTCEVTPHHLFLSTNDYTTLEAKAKVNPPVRPTANCEALWVGLLDGTVDCVATDHAPHLLSEKADPVNPPSGMPGVEVVVRLMLSVAAGHWPHPSAPRPVALQGGATVTLDLILRSMFEKPNAIFRLGCSEEPKLLLCADPEHTETIDEKKLHSKCGWSQYHGWTVAGKVGPYPPTSE